MENTIEKIETYLVNDAFIDKEVAKKCSEHIVNVIFNGLPVLTFPKFNETIDYFVECGYDETFAIQYAGDICFDIIAKTCENISDWDSFNDTFLSYIAGDISLDEAFKSAMNVEN